MRKIKQHVAIACLMVLSSPLVDEASAQQANRVAGHALARRICSECHAVENKAARSPNLDAPTFRMLANARGMTADYLWVEFRRAHQTMPDIDLSPAELRDVIAYIMSLRRAN